MPVNLDSVFSQYVNKIDHPIIALETGCSYHWPQENLQYLSTPCIARMVANTGGKLYSLDIDKNHIDICRYNLEKMGLDKYVEFILGDSVESIRNLAASNINFVWLDSYEDSNHAVSEFRTIAPKLANKHIVCVDDYGCPNSVKWQEVGSTIVRTFKEHGIFNTPTGLIVGCNGG